MKKKTTEINDTTNSSNPSIEIVSNEIKPLELNVGGHLHVSGAEIQLMVDKLNEIIKKVK